MRHIDSSGIQIFTKSSQPGLPSADILIDGNDVEDTGLNEMITVAGVNRFEVRNNRVHNRTVGTNGGEGIDIKQGAKNGSVHHNEICDLNTNRSGIYIDAWNQRTENIDVHSTSYPPYEIPAYEIFCQEQFVSNAQCLIRNYFVLKIFNKPGGIPRMKTLAFHYERSHFLIFSEPQRGQERFCLFRQHLAFTEKITKAAEILQR